MCWLVTILCCYLEMMDVGSCVELFVGFSKEDGRNNTLIELFFFEINTEKHFSTDRFHIAPVLTIGDFLYLFRRLDVAVCCSTLTYWRTGCTFIYMC